EQARTPTARPDQAAPPAGGAATPAPETVTSAASAPSAPAPPVPAPPGPDAPSASAGAETPVTVVPGIGRYHRAECILIRFLGEEDLEVTTKQAAQAAGSVPCKACRPD
ncbi:MAG TPA: hypothetical protein VIZ00_00070, partial [Streptosporangiaceae bacterium]